MVPPAIAALVGQFRADVAFREAFDLMAAVAGLRLEELFATCDRGHLRLIGDVLHGRGRLACAGSLK